MPRCGGRAASQLSPAQQRAHVCLTEAPPPLPAFLHPAAVNDKALGMRTKPTIATDDGLALLKVASLAEAEKVLKEMKGRELRAAHEAVRAAGFCGRIEAGREAMGWAAKSNRSVPTLPLPLTCPFPPFVPAGLRGQAGAQGQCAAARPPATDPSVR